MIVVKCDDYCDGNGLCIKNTRAVDEKVRALVDAAKAVLYHDERGQGQGYAEAMDALNKALAQLEGDKK